MHYIIILLFFTSTFCDTKKGNEKTGKKQWEKENREIIGMSMFTMFEEEQKLEKNCKRKGKIVCGLRRWKIKWCIRYIALYCLQKTCLLSKHTSIKIMSTSTSPLRYHEFHFFFVSLVRQEHLFFSSSASVGFFQLFLLQQCKNISIQWKPNSFSDYLFFNVFHLQHFPHEQNHRRT